jgi:DNA-binding beta-propeller fold protein YncE
MRNLRLAISLLVLSLALIVQAATLSAQESAKTAHLKVVMEITTGDGPLKSPSSVGVDSEGNIFVVDGGNDRIQVFDPSGQFLRGWGKHGSGEGEFDLKARTEPLTLGELAIDADDHLYVVDSFNERVQKFDNAGNFLLEWGSSGREDGQFVRPLGVAVNPDGTIYVIDDRRNTVQVFDAQGKFLFRFGKPGHEAGQIYDTGLVAVDSEGNAYVADYGNNRVDKFAGDGTFIKQWGTTGTGEGEFTDPVGICTDTQGHVYVAEYGGKRLQMFDNDGTFLAAWSEAGDTVFGSLVDVTVDAEGFLYVVDSSSSRILKLEMVE